MQEQGQRIEIESPGLSALGSRSTRFSVPVMAAAAAVLFVALTGAGLLFWQDDGPDVAEIAAGTEEEQSEDAEAAEQTDNDAADSAADSNAAADGGDDEGGDDAGFVVGSLRVDGLSPLEAEVPETVMVEDGWYYALSWAQSSPDWAGAMTDSSAWEAAGFDPSWLAYRTLNVLDPGNKDWLMSDFGDRFVTTFAVDDRVITVLSLGTFDGPQPAIGRSSDHGETWEWETVENLPLAESYSLVTTDQETLLFVTKFGVMDYNLANEWAVDSGIVSGPGEIIELSPAFAAYLPGSAGDECDQFRQNARATLNSLLSDSETDDSESLDSEYVTVAAIMRSSAEDLSCTLDSRWDTPSGMREFNEAVADGVIEINEPVSVAWEDLGYSVPDEWLDVHSLFRVDGNQLEPLDLPFEDIQGGQALEVDGAMQIHVANLAEYGVVPDQTLWSTVDGQSWESRTITLAEALTDPTLTGIESNSQQQPTIGGDLYRVQPLPVDNDLGFTNELQRRSDADGEWVTVDLAEIIPELGDSERFVDRVVGTPLGLFVSLTEPPVVEPSGLGLTILHSADGVTWETFDLDANFVSFYSGEDSVLVVGTSWPDGDEAPAIESLLVTSAE